MLVIDRMSELFPNRVRGRALSVATISLWAACLLITFTCLLLVETIGQAGAFWLYGAISAFTKIGFGSTSAADGI